MLSFFTTEWNKKIQVKKALACISLLLFYCIFFFAFLHHTFTVLLVLEKLPKGNKWNKTCQSCRNWFLPNETTFDMVCFSKESFFILPAPLHSFAGLKWNWCSVSSESCMIWEELKWFTFFLILILFHFFHWPWRNVFVTMNVHNLSQ